MDPMIADGTCLKRKVESELNYQVKRDESEGMHLLDIHLEIIQYIFSYLKLSELTKFGLISKKCSDLTANTPYWKNLCWSEKLEQAPKQTAKDCFMQALKENNLLALKTPANIFCESKDLQVKDYINCALEEFHMLERKVEPGSVKVEIENKIQYLNAIYGFRKYKPLLLSDDQIHNNFVDIIGGELSLTIRAIAITYLALIRMKSLPPDQRNIDLLESIHVNPVASWVKAESYYLLAILRLIGSNDSISDDQALGYLQNASQNNEAQPLTRAMAGFHIAKMTIDKRTRLVTYDEAAKLLYNFIQNEEMSVHNVEHAKHLLALLRLQKHTTLISDDETFKIFQSNVENQTMPLNYRLKANFYIATMVIQGRSNLMTIEQAKNLYQTRFN